MTAYIVWLLLFSNLQRDVPLQWDADLSVLATERAEYLCDKKQWSHEGWLDSFSEYPAHSFVGENLARGFTKYKKDDLKRATATYLAWMKSETHKTNMLNPTFKYTGIGTSCNITVQLFADKKLVK